MALGLCTYGEHDIKCSEPAGERTKCIVQKLVN